MRNELRTVVRIFDPIDESLSRVPCPGCGLDVVVFKTAHEQAFTVNCDGTLHILTCSASKMLRDILHYQAEFLDTGYDVAILKANAKFCPPFL
jgi:ribosomal protein S27E